MAGFGTRGNRILFPSVAGFRPVLLNKVTAQLILARLEANILEQSIRMREGQDASIAIVWVGDALKAKIGELARNFSSTFRGFGFDHESVQPQPIMVMLRAWQNSRAESSHSGFFEREKRDIEEVYEVRG